MVFDPFEELDTALARHFLIGEEDVDLAGGEMSTRGIGAIRRKHVEFRAEEDLQRVQNGWFIIHDEEGTLVPAHLAISLQSGGGPSYFYPMSRLSIKPTN
jgi:hypothetical protein